MIRVLQVYPRLNNAGTEKCIMNLYENIDRSQVQFDFLLQCKGELDEYVMSLGSQVFYLPFSDSTEYYNQLITFFRKFPEYEIIHTHTDTHMGIVLKAAKFAGVKVRIAHSHNARTDLSKIFWWLKRFKTREIESNATNFLACSTLAAKWLFPRRHLQCQVVYNAINIDRFKFKEEERNKFRQLYGLTMDTKVLCYVARFAPGKNHLFLIELFAELVGKLDEVKLIFVGVGPLEEEMKKKVGDLQLQEKILFLGNRYDVENVLSASDVFVFPSSNEGLGIVAVEAQVNGLACIASKGIPIEADLGLGLFHQLALNVKKKAWIDRILQCIEYKQNRNELNKKYLEKYDIKLIASSMQNFYLSQL